MSEAKLCRDCRKEKPLTAFARHPLPPDGYDYLCRQCRAKASYRYARAHYTVPMRDEPSAEQTLDRLADTVDRLADTVDRQQVLIQRLMRRIATDRPVAAPARPVAPSYTPRQTDRLAPARTAAESAPSASERTPAQERPTLRAVDLE